MRRWSLEVGRSKDGGNEKFQALVVWKQKRTLAREQRGWWNVALRGIWSTVRGWNCERSDSPAVDTRSDSSKDAGIEVMSRRWLAPSLVGER